MTRMRLAPVLVAAIVATAASTLAAQERSNAASIRAGRGIATATCVACHVVSPDQTLKPIYAGLAPNFDDIANRPATSKDSLLAFLNSSHWSDPALLVKPAPMRLISDREKSDVAAFILSLRRQK